MDVKYKKAWVAAGVLIFIIAGLSIWYLQDDSLRNLWLYRKMAVEDWTALKNSSAKPEDVKTALTRLSQRLDPGVREEALRRADDSNVQIRGAAVAALGYFTDDQALKVVEKHVHDPEASVRLEALRALGRQPQAVRLAFLKKHVAETNLDLAEKNAALISIFSNSLSKEERLSAYKNMVEFAVAGNEEVRLQLRQLLIRIGYGFSKVTQVLDAEYKRNKDALLAENVQAVCHWVQSASQGAFEKDIRAWLGRHALVKCAAGR